MGCSSAIHVSPRCISIRTSSSARLADSPNVISAARKSASAGMERTLAGMAGPLSLVLCHSSSVSRFALAQLRCEDKGQRTRDKGPRTSSLLQILVGLLGLAEQEARVFVHDLHE